MSISDVVQGSEGSRRVLLLLPTSGDAELTRRILADQNIQTAACRDLDELCKEAKAGAGVLLIAEEHLLTDSSDRIGRFLREQPTWSDLPLLILTTPSGINNTALVRWQRSSHVTLIPRPIRIQSFISTIHSRLTDRDRQYVVRDLLQSLDQRSREFRQMADSMPNIVFAADAEGNITYLNAKTYEYIGPDIDLYGNQWINAVDPNDRDRAVARWQHSVSTGEEYQVEFRIMNQHTGVYHWHIARGVPIREGNRIVRWFGTCTDIHDQKMIEQRLNEALDDADAANQAKSEFLANMSHEIRTPMTAVLGYADLLASEETDPGKLGFLRVIRRNGQFLLEIINDILDLSKIEAGKLEVSKEWFEAHRLAYEVHSMMQVRAAEKKIDLKVDFAGQIPERIHSDPKRLKQILVNLVGNAIKFTDKGQVEIRAWYEEPKFTFAIVDSGIGMTGEHLSQLFQPFHQLDSSVSRQFGGSGLGLVISQRLANMLGGEIEVQSEYGVGSTFRCSIDAGDVSAELMISPEMDRWPEHRQVELATAPVTCRVLVVDDRRDVRFLAGHILKKIGAKVFFAENGLESTELVEREMNGGQPPDIVFMDMQMPVMDGYQATSQLRQLGFSNPIIALTADAMQGDMDRCIASGCDDYISKPIDSAELLKVVLKYATPA